MGTYALVKDQFVVNIIVWDGPEDGENAMDFGEGISAVEFAQGDVVGIGFKYSNGKFAAPDLTDEEIAEREAVAKIRNITTKDSLMAEAGKRISVLQDAVELDMATDEEKGQLTAWKKYRVLLSRVDASISDDIEWPLAPDQQVQMQ